MMIDITPNVPNWIELQLSKRGTNHRDNMELQPSVDLLTISNPNFYPSRGYCSRIFCPSTGCARNPCRKNHVEPTFCTTTSCAQDPTYRSSGRYGMIAIILIGSSGRTKRRLWWSLMRRRPSYDDLRFWVNFVKPVAGGDCNGPMIALFSSYGSRSTVLYFALSVSWQSWSLNIVGIYRVVLDFAFLWRADKNSKMA